MPMRRALRAPRALPHGRVRECEARAPMPWPPRPPALRGCPPSSPRHWRRPQSGVVSSLRRSRAGRARFRRVPRSAKAKRAARARPRASRTSAEGQDGGLRRRGDVQRHARGSDLVVATRMQKTIDANGRGQRRAAALGNAELEDGVRARDDDAQMSGRRKAFGGGGAKEDGHRSPCFGSHLQAAKPCIVQLPLSPKQHRTARAGLERLLRGPHRVFSIGGTHDEAAIDRNARLRKRGCVWHMRRIDPGDEAIAFGGACKGAGEKTHFADPHAVVKDFRERSHGPAAARKLAIERVVPCRYRGRNDMLELPTAPDARQLRERGNAHLHATPRERLRITPTAMPSIASVSRARSRCRVLKSALAGMSSALLPRIFKRFTVTSSPTRATTSCPLFASPVRCTTSQSPSRMPSSFMLRPRTCSR